jgi:hypothetical protein
MPQKLLIAANVPTSLILSTLKIEVTYSSELSVQHPRRRRSSATALKPQNLSKRMHHSFMNSVLKVIFPKVSIVNYLIS